MTFLVIPPQEVNSANLDESNVIETPAAAYAGGTTYGLGDLVTEPVLPASGLLDVYESLQAGNSGHTPASSPLWWVKVGQVYEEWSSGKTYTADARVQITALHKVYQSVQNSNTNHNPSSDTTQEWWVEVGPTNRWAMFDTVVGTQTVRPELIHVEIDVTDRIDALILDNIDAASVHYKMWSVADGTIREETVSLVSDDGVTDWWAYFMLPIVRKRFMYVTELPPYANFTLEVDVQAPGGEAKAGLFLMGLGRYIGETLTGSTVGRRSRTRLIEDDFGNLVVVKRPSSKRGEFQVLLEASAVDGVIDLLDQYDGVPVFMLGSARFGSSGMIGVVDQYNVELATYTHAYLSITPRGLI